MSRSKRSAGGGGKKSATNPHSSAGNGRRGRRANLVDLLGKDSGEDGSVNNDSDNEEDCTTRNIGDVSASTLPGGNQETEIVLRKKVEELERALAVAKASANTAPCDNGKSSSVALVSEKAGFDGSDGQQLEDIEEIDGGIGIVKNATEMLDSEAFWDARENRESILAGEDSVAVTFNGHEGDIPNEEAGKERDDISQNHPSNAQIPSPAELLGVTGQVSKQQVNASTMANNGSLSSVSMDRSLVSGDEKDSKKPSFVRKIERWTVSFLFRKIKITSPEDFGMFGQIAIKCMEEFKVNINDMATRESFWLSAAGPMQRCLAARRNNVAHLIKEQLKGCLEWDGTNPLQPRMPSYTDIFLRRQNPSAYSFFCYFFVRIVVGATLFKTTYESEWKVGEALSASDEAFALCVLEGIWPTESTVMLSTTVGNDSTAAEHHEGESLAGVPTDQQQEGPVEKGTVKKGLYKNRYTVLAGEDKDMPHGGWTEEGVSRYNKLLEEIIVERNDRNLVAAFEDHFASHITEVTGGRIGKKGKKRKRIVGESVDEPAKPAVKALVFW